MTAFICFSTSAVAGNSSETQARRRCPSARIHYLYSSGISEADPLQLDVAKDGGFYKRAGRWLLWFPMEELHHLLRSSHSRRKGREDIANHIHCGCQRLLIQHEGNKILHHGHSCDFPAALYCPRSYYWLRHCSRDTTPWALCDGIICMSHITTKIACETVSFSFTDDEYNNLSETAAHIATHFTLEHKMTTI
jgi:hypothetical protein